jgi:Zn-dependent membrane protease YugP
LAITIAGVAIFNGAMAVQLCNLPLEYDVKHFVETQWADLARLSEKESWDLKRTLKAAPLNHIAATVNGLMLFYDLVFHKPA